jgi:hypothetical protein
MQQFPGAVVDVSRMPPGISVLQDMKHWTRTELNSWTAHALAGQRGSLPKDQIFQLREIPGGAGIPA